MGFLRARSTSSGRAPTNRRSQPRIQHQHPLCRRRGGLPLAQHAAAGRYAGWTRSGPLGECGTQPAFQAYNADCLAAIASLDDHHPGINIVGVNVYSLVESMLADPSAYGFTNINMPAQGKNVNPNDY